MQAEDKEPATPPKKTSRRRFLKILAGTACAVGIGKGIDLLLPLTLCRPGEWSGPITDHFNGRHFFNPARYGKHNTHKSASVFRWLFRKRVKGHYPEVTTNRYTPELATTVDGRDWEITMVNHATMLIRVGGLNILTDPIWSDYTSPVQGVGPKRKRPVGIAWNDLPKIDVCLLSHDHYDHFDAATLTRLYRRDNPLFIVPLGLRSLLNYHTGGTPRCEEKDWWDSIAVTPQVTITLTPALHWSRRYRHAEDSNRSLWCGFFMQVKDGPSVYFAGDTAAGTIQCDKRNDDDRNEHRPFLYVNRTVPQSFPLLFCPSSLRSGCICRLWCWFARVLLGRRPSPAARLLRSAS